MMAGDAVDAPSRPGSPIHSVGGSKSCCTQYILYDIVPTVLEHEVMGQSCGISFINSSAGITVAVTEREVTREREFPFAGFLVKSPPDRLWNFLMTLLLFRKNPCRTPPSCACRQLAGAVHKDLRNTRGIQKNQYPVT